MKLTVPGLRAAVRPILAGGIMLVGMVGANLIPGVHLPVATPRVLPCSALPGQAEPPEGRSHLPYLGAPHAPYRTEPPTSGPHLPWIIATGVYRAAIPEELQVHLLEHGNVLVQYPVDAPERLRQQLEAIVRMRPDKVVVAPYPKLRGGVALTAWQRLELLPGYDRPAIERFVTALAGRYDHGWVSGADACI
jgi:hypothetical protein